MSNNRTPPHKMIEMETNNKSIIALKQALIDVIKHPQEANQELMGACSSQGKLAALNLDDIKISSMSLNAQKSACDRVFDGGYTSIDQLRLRARDVYEQFKASTQTAKSGTKTYYIQQLSEMKEENQNLIDSSVFLANKYYELLQLAQRTIARASEGKLVAENEARLLNQHLEKFNYTRFGDLRIYDGSQQ